MCQIFFEPIGHHISITIHFFFLHIFHPSWQAGCPRPIMTATVRLLCLLVQYQECVATGVWAKLFFFYAGTWQVLIFSSSNPPCLHVQGSKHPANAKRREQHKTYSRREAWVVKGKAATAAAIPAAPAAKQAAVADLAEATAAPPAAAARAWAKQVAVVIPLAVTTARPSARAAPPVAARAALQVTAKQVTLATSAAVPAAPPAAKAAEKQQFGQQQAQHSCQLWHLC